MGYRFSLSLLLATVLLPLSVAGGTTVAVHTVDEATVSGRLVSLDNGSITVDVSKDEKTPRLTTVPLGDVARVVFREPPPKVKPFAEADVPKEGEAPRKSVFGMILSLFTSDDNQQAPNPAAQNDVQPVPRPTTRPEPDDWQIRLADGGSVRARVIQWSGPILKVKLDEPLAQEVQIPVDQVTHAWCASAADVARAISLRHDSSSEDVAFVEKDQDIIPVNGHALGIDGSALKFRYGEAERKIALNRLVGIAFATGHPAAGSVGFHQTVSLDSGETLSGAWSGLDKDAIVLRTAWAPAVRVPLGSIYTIDFLGGRLVYLSDLKPAKVEQTPYFGRVVPFRLDASLDGGPLELAGAPCAKGIAVHSRCVLVYDIGPGYERFRSRLGFELPAGKLGRVAVRLQAGDRILYENADLRGDQPPVDLDFDITGQRQLKLEVDFGKGQDVGDRVIWGNARLVRSRLPDQPGK